MKRGLKWIIYVASVFCLIQVKTHAQNTTANTYLGKASSLFVEEKYDLAIQNCDQGMLLCNKYDSLYCELLFKKALCYNYLRSNDRAVPLLKDMLMNYSQRDSFYKRLSYIYISILFDTPSLYKKDEGLFNECCVYLLESNYRFDEVLEKYGYFLLRKINPSDIDSALNQEMKRIAVDEGNHLNIIPAFFHYIKANLVTNKYPGGLVTYRTNSIDKISEGIGLYKKCIKEFTALKSVISKRYLNDCYKELADLYEGLGYKAIAAEQLKGALDVQNNYWEEWGYKSPWAYPPNYMNNEMTLFSKYIGLLSDTEQYKEIINYCNQLLADDRLKKLNKTFSECVENSREEAIMASQSGAVDGAVDDAVDGAIGGDDRLEDFLYLKNLYDEGKVNQHLVDSLFNWHSNGLEYLYKYFYEKGDYKAILEISQYVQRYLEKNNCGVYFTKEDVMKGNCTQYELQLDSEREYFHHSNGFTQVWRTYYYTALAYLEKGDYDNAIKYQKRVIDNVRTDWIYEKDERKDLLNAYVCGRFTYMLPIYWHVEISMYCELARIYISAGKYKEAYDTYRRAIGINEHVLQNVMRTTSVEIRQKEWESNNDLYRDILENLSDKTTIYPPFSELVIEASAMEKGFMLNQHLLIRQLKNEEQISIERLLEQANYISILNVASHKIKLVDYEIKVQGLIVRDSILAKSLMPVSKIKSILRENDILIDFFIGSSNDKIAKSWIDVQKIEDNQYRASAMNMSFNNYHIYANVMRKGWNRPKVVSIGWLDDISKKTKKDIWDIVYIKNTPDYINELYSDTCLGNIIWGKVLNETRSSKDDNIYIIPSVILNDIAIENLSLSNGVTVSDRYKIYRISSVDEIRNSKKGYNVTDNCVAFGNIKYGIDVNVGKLNKTSNETFTLNSNPLALRKRIILKSLTSNVLESIRHYIPNTTLMEGLNANEYELYKLSKNASDILYLETHGFNYQFVGLTDEQKKYLLGEFRRTDLEKEEEAMYLSGLFLAPSRKAEVATDGALTAKEISLLDLHNTKLAVLSACSTARGYTFPLEGTYGLLRGLKMAGVQSVIASLWDVDKNATQLLMKEFFKHYTNGDDKNTALKKAQRYVREYKSNDVFYPIDYSNPYYWAGFIIVD